VSDAGSPAEVEVLVEFAFGSGPRDDLSSATWVDVTADVQLSEGSGGITTVSGRAGIRSDIEPGSCSFTLEDTLGHYDPRNSAGPYYGDLRLGVPVRITTTYSATTEDRWVGFVSNGWPQQPAVNGMSLVNVTAEDTPGVLARGDTPETAFHAAVRQADANMLRWFQPSPEGWIDRVSGSRGRHTGGLTEFDPAVDGDEKAFGNGTGDGYGVVPTLWGTGAAGGSSMLLVVMKMTAPFGTAPSVLDGLFTGQLSVIGNNPDNTANFYIDGNGSLAVSMPFGTGASDARAWQSNFTSAQFLFDGRTHVLLARCDSAKLDIWIDGVHVDDAPATDTTQSWSAQRPTVEQFIGRERFGSSPTLRYAGVIDHVVAWDSLNLTTAQCAELALEVSDAARTAWGNQRLDERLESIVSGSGYSERLGALDVSGIVTLQGYRQADALELLQKIEQTEQGRVWADRHGDLRFSARKWAEVDSRSTSVQLYLSDDPTLQDAGTAFPMLADSLEILDDQLSITNVAQVTSEFGRQQTRQADASVAAIGQRNPISLSGLLHRSDRESAQIAEWLVFALSDPDPTIRSVAFHVDPNASALAPIAQLLEQGDLVRVGKKAKLTPGTGVPIGSDLDLYGHVIGLEHMFGFGGWYVVLHLDPTRVGRTWFTWGTSTWGNTVVEGWSF